MVNVVIKLQLLTVYWCHCNPKKKRSYEPT